MNILVEMLIIAGGMVLGMIAISLIFMVFMCSKLYTKLMTKLLNVSMNNMSNVYDITDEEKESK